MKTRKILLLALIAASALLIGSKANAQKLQTTAMFSRDLSLGSQGADVGALQKILIAGGYLAVPAPTNYFGGLTKTAVIAWQNAAGITPASGYFGPLSRIKVSIPASPQPPLPLPLPIPTPAPLPISLPTPVIPPASTTPAASTTAPSGLPARLTIPKLNIDAPIIQEGLAANGSIDSPKTITDIGWYNGSVLPGQIGSSVMVGHVAQVRGGVVTKPGVLGAVNTLSAGDKIYVTNDWGQITAFNVREMRVYEPNASATEVFYASTGGSHLNLITCEGLWDQAKLSYSGRLVLFADRAE